ncbi:hypothetical protein PoB_002472400 [Plakobranchus ocellatus]|uniref:Uncharacterized protein n=1 Tax=Plakobranchus ocellatus TaxID=259542 RepID=A0AAV3ZSA5_9GAST|nr:hypothetical protein PoB_002472400 [Plakobranchus ocellatus]
MATAHSLGCHIRMSLVRGGAIYTSYTGKTEKMNVLLLSLLSHRCLLSNFAQQTARGPALAHQLTAEERTASDSKLLLQVRRQILH